MFILVSLFFKALDHPNSVYRHLKRKEKKGKKETTESLYSNFIFTMLNLQPFLYMENSFLLIVNIEIYGNRMKHYIDNTFVYPTNPN